MSPIGLIFMTVLNLGQTQEINHGKSIIFKTRRNGSKQIASKGCATSVNTKFRKIANLSPQQEEEATVVSC